MEVAQIGDVLSECDDEGEVTRKWNGICLFLAKIFLKNK